MDIFLWNQAPGDLDDSVGELIAEACNRQMQEDVAPAYGLEPPPKVSFLPHTVKPEDLPGNCLVIIFAVDPPAAAAAVAGLMTAPAPPRDAAPLPTTRDWDDHGRNFARVYPGTILAEGTISTGAHSISAATSHECIEATYDRNLARWVWNEKGEILVACEVCDQVEEDFYNKLVHDQEVAVSNFVYPAWFDAQAPPGSQFDQMKLLNEPFTCTDGGYIILYDPAKPGDKVHTEPPESALPWGWNAKSKSDGFARTRVRLVW
jgi:hypothetical protein